MEQKQEQKFFLASNCSIFSTNPDEYRIRKGIWNYEEAKVVTTGLNPAFKEIVVELFGKLDAGEAIDADEYLARVADENSRELFKGMINSLKVQRYLIPEIENHFSLLLSELIGGTMSYRYINNFSSLPPVAMICDMETTAEYADLIAKEMGLPLTVMQASDVEKFAAADLTTRYDGLATAYAETELAKALEPYACVCVSLASPKLTLLRNLNRVAVETSKMLAITLLDGPFLTAMTLKPKETGCFECFENRILARLEDLSAYRAFAAKKSARDMKGKTYLAPLLNAFTSVVLFEAFTYACVGKSKLAGRVLNLYIPAFEIQVQDLLRIPSCPACGFVSQAQMEDMYTSSSQIVEELANNVILK